MRDWIFLWGQALIERGAWFFAPLSWLWGFCSFVKNLSYDLRWRSIRSLPRATVSVGNLVAGGTGKTPFVHLLAQNFSHRKVAILSRGYGPFADEAELLARRLPQAKVYIGRDRLTLGKKAVAEGAELLILDDGFQYRKLFRDFDLVLLDGQDPFGKGHYLPWGYLRDSPRRLKQADAVFINGKDLHLATKRILNLKGEEISSVSGWKVALFSGIAKPAKFKKTVVDLGADVVDEWVLQDHALICINKLNAFAEKSRHLGARALLCTEKDAVRLSTDLKVALPLLFLEMEMKISNWEKLIEKIDQKIDNYLSLCSKR